VRRILIAFLLLAAAGCSEPPQKELDQAQAAIDAARAAGAEREAADDFSGAVTTLQKAHDAVDQRDYRQALSYAIDARQRALEAAKHVAEGKANAETLYKAASDRAARLENAIHAAEEARVPAHELRDPRAALDAGRTSLQEARTRLDKGNVADATAALDGVREKLDTALKSTEQISQRAKKGRRH
jgi:hypothetical protein